MHILCTLMVPDAATLDVEMSGEMHTFTQFPDSAVDEEETTDSSRLVDKKEHPVWSFAFYQTLFDVDARVVLNRIRGSMLPLPSRSFTKSYIGGHPDLYGPFWICATLVLVVGICGNITTLLSHLTDEHYHYTPQFERLSVAAVLVYSYSFIIPLLVRGILWWRKIAALTVPDIMCVYGYSLFIFIPVAFLLLIPIEWLDWVFLVVATCLSGAVILLSLWPAFRDDSRQVALVVLLILFACHSALPISFRLYFFSPIPVGSAGTSNVTSTLSVSTLASTKFSTWACQRTWSRKCNRRMPASFYFCIATLLAWTGCYVHHKTENCSQASYCRHA